MSKKLEKWKSEEGILDELHRIREESYKVRRRVGLSAWLKRINSAGKHLTWDKPRKRTHASS